MNQQRDDAQERVQARYGEFAQEVMETERPLPFSRDGYEPYGEASTEKLADRLYQAADLIDIPEPAINASIGCGNPLALASLKPGEYVLDLGSGGGIDCFQAAKAVGETGCVIGVDATPEMIELANKNKVKMGVDNVEFRLGNIEALPVESDTIDLVISNCVIDISPNKADVFAEAYRVLKENGRLAISDTVLLGNIPPQLKANIDIWAGAVITPLISLNEFLQFIVEAGFIDVRVDSLTSYGLENFEQLDAESQQLLMQGISWTPLPPNMGLYSATIYAQKP